MSDTDFRGLLWGRLYVSAGRKKWVTDWKVLKATWVRWLGSCVNGSPRCGENWFVDGGGPATRIDRVEASHWMPLPAPPADFEEREP
jgi:hypothetical protein